MIKIKWRREGSNAWIDAWLVQMLSDQHAMNGFTAIVAFQEPGDTWGEQGLRIVRERDVHHIRIARSRIPLFSTAQANGAQSPDAPKV